MNKKQLKLRASKMSKKALALRQQLWPKLDETKLWDRTVKKGFTTIPRTMPHVLQIMDDLAEPNKPVSNTYLSLWCRVFDESMIEIKNYGELAFEAGFSGQRAVTVWKGRMKNLVDLGFIAAEAGATGLYDYILLFNPYVIIKEHYESERVQKHKYTALLARSQDIGADDLI